MGVSVGTEGRIDPPDSERVVVIWLSSVSERLLCISLLKLTDTHAHPPRGAQAAGIKSPHGKTYVVCVLRQIEQEAAISDDSQ